MHNTHDDLSVQFYDCITDTNLPYCRRSSEPFNLYRDQLIWYCDHYGIRHGFSSLFLENVSFSTVLYRWSSSINPQSFGKHDEYLLPMSTNGCIILNGRVLYLIFSSLISLFYKNRIYQKMQREKLYNFHKTFLAHDGFVFHYPSFYISSVLEIKSATIKKAVVCKV